MKVLLLPDKFKGTLSAMEIASVMEEAVKSVEPDAKVKSFPVADGGEGSLVAFNRLLNGEIISLSVTGPDFEKLRANYLLKDDKAVIELAEASGLLRTKIKNPLYTTTYGTGELIADAKARGAKEIILCIGGSATNDMGVGLASALGIKFYDDKNSVFVPTGGNLNKIAKIDFSNRIDISFTVLCDVKNPLHGKNGAAYVYAPQKGASASEVEVLDDNLKHLSGLLKSKYNIDVESFEGAGAAGGVGAGMKAFFKSELKSGIDTVLSLLPKEEILDADLVLTGEGRFDLTSLTGKVVGGVAKYFKKIAPVIAVVGEISRDYDKAEKFDNGLTAVISTMRTTGSYFDVAPYAKDDIKLLTSQIIKIYVEGLKKR